MINLLPHHEKKKLASEYHMRTAAVVCAALLLLQVVGSAIIGIVYMKISSETSAVAATLAEEKKKNTPAAANPQTELNAIKGDVALLAVDPSTATLPSEYLAALTDLKSAGIRFTSYAYGVGPTGLEIDISGVADSRSDMIYFQRVLRDDSRFAKADYDQNFVTKKPPIDFRLSIPLNSK